MPCDLRRGDYLTRQPTLVHGELLGFAQYDRPFNNVLWLTSISRPGVRRQAVQTLPTYTANLLSCLSSITVDEILDQHRNVFFSFAQRRDCDRKHIQPIEQVAPKCARSNDALQVTIGCGNHANIRPYYLVPAHPFKLSFLQDTQQSYLGFTWKFTYLVKENGPTFGPFKAA